MSRIAGTLGNVLVVILVVTILALPMVAAAETAERMVEIPTRPGVTVRFLHLAPANAKAAVILFSGGQGELQLTADGELKSGRRNFLVRSRRLFAEQGLSVAVVDAPSDRQSPPFLGGFRETAEHVADVKAVIAWMRKQSGLPVWLVGTSRGTQSAAFVATELTPADGGPDAIVLSSTILQDRGSRAVPEMNVAAIAVPVLVVHHQDDGCRLCPYSQVPQLMRRLSGSARKELVTITGGENTGDPCQPMAHHGFNGQEAEVVTKITSWMLAH